MPANPDLTALTAEVERLRTICATLLNTEDYGEYVRSRDQLRAALAPESEASDACPPT